MAIIFFFLNNANGHHTNLRFFSDLWLSDFMKVLEVSDFPIGLLINVKEINSRSEKSHTWLAWCK